MIRKIKFVLTALLVFVSCGHLPAYADQPVTPQQLNAAVLSSSTGSSSASTILDSIASCSKNFTDVSGCTGVETVSTQAALETCAEKQGRPICLLDTTINVTTNNDEGYSTYLGVFIDVAKGARPAVVCAPGVEIRVTTALNQDDTMFMFDSSRGSLDNSLSFFGTVSAANPVQIFAAGHGLSNGDSALIVDSGMDELDNRFFTIANANTNDFTLVDEDGNPEDGTGRSTSTSGYLARDLDSGPELAGCSIIEYDSTTGLPGSNDREEVWSGSSPENTTGVVFSHQTSDATRWTIRRNFKTDRNTIQVYSNGTSSFALGQNPDQYTNQVHTNNIISAPNGILPKAGCNGCDDSRVELTGNIINCDTKPSGTGSSTVPQGFKLDNNATYFVQGNTFNNCIINSIATNYDATLYPALSAGDIYMYDNTIRGPTFENYVVLVSDGVVGTQGWYGRRNIVDNVSGTNEFMQVWSGIEGDIEFTDVGCTDESVDGAWFDIVDDPNESPNASSIDEVMGDFRMVVHQPPGCSSPDANTGNQAMVGTGTVTHINNSNTQLFVKVGTTAKHIDGVNTRDIFKTVATDPEMGDRSPTLYGVPYFATGGTVGELDTGDLVGLSVGGACLGAYTVSTGAALADCATAFTVPTIVMIQKTDLNPL